tara:strand:+ start:6961 stop:7122 length:162 start_codon:yes stop_codon:yes gene_type:complete
MHVEPDEEIVEVESLGVDQELPEAMDVRRTMDLQQAVPLYEQSELLFGEYAQF